MEENKKIIPFEGDTSKYSPNEKKKIMAVYTEIVHYAAKCEALGNEVLDPTLKSLDTLVKIENKVKKLPEEIQKSKPFRKYMNTIEFYIGRCKERKETAKEMIPAIHKTMAHMSKMAKEIKDHW